MMPARILPFPSRPAFERRLARLIAELREGERRWAEFHAACLELREDR